MDKIQLQNLLRQFKSGAVGEQEVMDTLKDFPMVELGYAHLDTHRSLRQGFPEVVFGLGKTPAQTLEIVERLSAVHHTVLTTKASPEAMNLLRENFPGAEFFLAAKAVIVRKNDYIPVKIERIAALISAGTSDQPVSEEAAATLKAMDIPFQVVQDVGVAGIHRILKYKDLLNDASVVIVIAGMEGALASIVAGLTPAPVIAVPTSVGYGASFQGLAALLGMLNSCASGVTVVNIDNGFGAAAAAAKIIRKTVNL